MRVVKPARHLGARLNGDERGSVIIWFGVMLTTLIALIGLAVNVVAYMNLNSSLQEVADAAALAGANKLDGTAGAKGRAETAAFSALGNSVTWSNDGNSSGSLCDGKPCPIDTVSFYLTLDDLKKGVKTTADNAAYIKVTTKSRSLLANFMIGKKSAVTKASAAAGSSYVTCAPLQSFMCNPYEPNDSSGDASTFMSSGKVKIGDQFVLVQGSGSDPGNWGLIQPIGTSGNSEKVHAPFWSKQGTSSCTAYAPGTFTQKTAPGNAAKNAVAGMNVRFDRMTDVAGVDLKSAPIVISGFSFKNSYDYTAAKCARTEVATPPSGYSQTNNCTDAAAKDKLTVCLAESSTSYGKYIASCNTNSGSCPFPRDRVFEQLGTATGWGNMLKGKGANTDDLDAYWANHHSGKRPAALDTRYKIYEKEVDGTYAFVNTSKESPQPKCTAGLPASTSVDRRLLNVAIVDCKHYKLTGRDDLPTATLSLKMFMTEPATSDGEIYGELVSVSAANESGGPIHHIVTLVQ